MMLYWLLHAGTSALYKAQHKTTSRTELALNSDAVPPVIVGYIRGANGVTSPCVYLAGILFRLPHVMAIL